MRVGAPYSFGEPSPSVVYRSYRRRRIKNDPTIITIEKTKTDTKRLVTCSIIGYLFFVLTCLVRIERKSRLIKLVILWCAKGLFVGLIRKGFLKWRILNI